MDKKNIKSRKTLSIHNQTKNAHPYSSKIIKAGALIGDTKILLSHWDISASVSDNIARVLLENLFGKASRSRVSNILAIFRQRYLTDESLVNSLVTLTNAKFSASALDRIFYYHTALADRLLYDSVVEIIYPMYENGMVDINIVSFKPFLSKLVLEGKTSGHWSEATIVRITQGLLSALRDFGVLQGEAKKKIAPVFLPVEAFSYIVFYMKQHQPSGAKLLELPDWKLFFLSKEMV